jgi:BirA family biotin operon repressor/biotin-[acetyl-CoA-carboxylase] ligase
MSTREELLGLLDDRRFQSGAELGRRLGVSRAAVQQHISALRSARVPIVIAPRLGYRLDSGVSLLDPERISVNLSVDVVKAITSLEVLTQVDSTNNYLLFNERKIHGAVALAEDQHGGRGRREKRWCATPYRNLMLSVGWMFSEWPAAVTALGLVTALAVTRALASSGVKGLGLKWPNDLMYQDKKLGGILVDLAGEASGNCRAVIGIGINIKIDAADAVEIQQPWIDLAAFVASPIDRNRLAASVITEVIHSLEQFPRRGFVADAKEWRRRHILQDRQVEIVSEQQTLLATVEGVDSDGALIVCDSSGDTHRFFHGEVSVRP